MKLTTAGESHGKGLIAILEGLPAGLALDVREMDVYLALRQSGYGRGARQKIESDRAEILSGVRDGVTLGSPLAIAVWNRDYENWKAYMAPEGCDVSARTVTKVRPAWRRARCAAPCCANWALKCADMCVRWGTCAMKRRTPLKNSPCAAPNSL